ncbi:HNH endonuclease [bacterium]|nr:HNH endonuclease [bacterium]
MPTMPTTHNQRLKAAEQEIIAGVDANVISPEAQYDMRRGSSTERGYGVWWRAYRKIYLIKNPFCVDPIGEHPGVVVAANVVDHIIAHKGNNKLFRDPSNHQAVCSHCNNVKAAKYEGGFGNKIKPIPEKDNA